MSENDLFRKLDGTFKIYVTLFEYFSTLNLELGSGDFSISPIDMRKISENVYHYKLWYFLEYTPMGEVVLILYFVILQ